MGLTGNQYFKNALEHSPLHCSHGWQGNEMSAEHAAENNYLSQSRRVRQNVHYWHQRVGKY